MRSNQSATKVSMNMQAKIDSSKLSHQRAPPMSFLKVETSKANKMNGISRQVDKTAFDPITNVAGNFIEGARQI